MGADGDLNEFDNRLKYSKNLVGNDPYGKDSDSSEEDLSPPKKQGPMALLEQKNRALFDRLNKSEKEVAELRNTMEALAGDVDSQKDKKIVELVKKVKQMQVKVEAFKNKSNEASELALELKRENEKMERMM